MEQIAAIQGRILDGLHLLAHYLAKALHLPAQLPWLANEQSGPEHPQIQLVALLGRERGDQPYPDPEYLRQEACKPWMPEAPGPPATSSSAPPELHTSPQLHTSHSNEERF